MDRGSNKLVQRRGTSSRGPGTHSHRWSSGAAGGQSGLYSSSFRGVCHCCKRPGHQQRDCRERQRQRGTKRSFVRSAAPAPKWCNSPGTAFEGVIIDLGATSHMTPWGEHLLNFRPNFPPICVQLADSRVIYAPGTGDLPLELNYGGTLKPVIMRRVLWAPDLGGTVFSVKAAQAGGGEVRIHNDRWQFITAEGQWGMTGRSDAHGNYVIDGRILRSEEFSRYPSLSVANSCCISDSRPAYTNKAHAPPINPSGQQGTLAPCHKGLTVTSSKALSLMPSLMPNLMSMVSDRGGDGCPDPPIRPIQLPY